MIEQLIGKTILEVKQSPDELIFILDGGERYMMYHSQDCCENVNIEDIIGDLNDLIGSPVTLAEKATSEEMPDGVNKEYDYSFTWTFYKIATIKGYVTIRWFGSSNGYYSESVDFVKINTCA